jgi:hypothetical protein
VDVLQDTNGKSRVSNDRINRCISVLSGNLLQRRAQLDEVLHHDFNHPVDSGSADSGNILDQDAAVGTKRCPQGTNYLEDSIKESFCSANVNLREIMRRITASESSKENDVLFTL